MDAWYKVVVPRKEVREGRSFNPDEFAVALEQVLAGTAPRGLTEGRSNDEWSPAHQQFVAARLTPR